MADGVGNGTGGPPARLTDDEVAKVLRRAAQLDPAAGTAGSDAGLPVAAVEAAAAEVGLSPAAVRLAVAELRAGALDAGGDRDAPVVCARVVPGACAGCLEQVGRWLQGQAMVRARDRGTEQVWRPREDWIAGVQRRFDWAAALRLKGVDEVVVRAVEVEGGTLVRVVARLQPAVARAPRIGAGAGAGVATVAGAAVAAATGEVALAAVTATPAAAALGLAGWRVGRRALASRRGRVSEAIDGLLDDLELGRAPGRSAFDRLAERARRLRGGERL